MVMNRTIILSAILFMVGQILIWFQSNGQFISEWFKNNTLIISFFGVPISYLFIHATRMSYEGFGATWPGRMMGFAVGVLVFTVLAYYFMGENVNLKTGLSLLLSIGIICIQVFMK
jgi:hypothetical protein